MHNNTNNIPTNEKKIAAMFNTIAPRYDFLNHLLSLRQDYRWRRKLAARIADRANLKLLDVATGTGDVIAACMQNKKNPPHCTGIDIATNMLSRAHTKLDPSVNLQQMSATSLSFIDNSFDVVTIAFGLRNVSDQRKALQEFHRVLKKDGQLLILEFFNLESGFFAPFFNFYSRQLLPRIASLFSDKAAYQYLPHSVANFSRYPELVQLAADCGMQQGQHDFFLHGAVGLLQFYKGNTQ